MANQLLACALKLALTHVVFFVLFEPAKFALRMVS